MAKSSKDRFKVMREEDCATVLDQCQKIIAQPGEVMDILQAVCDFLANEIDHYDWVGFYLTDPDKPDDLLLGPYNGEATDHTRIAFGSGICGQAAQSKETFLVADVSQETNYLSCSPVVKSEIVVPILRDGRVLGEIDIDSHILNPFNNNDQLLLEALARAIEQLL